ncbi:YraN family protein [candidate division WWE3 bacterium]|nr:YraN family protein [candidate division WWE3 bacterium]
MLEKQTLKALGKQGETAAAKYLESTGYIIVERNYYAGRFGEIDIVAKDDQTIIFVEVKTRMSLRYGSPIEAITALKLKKISKAANIYLKRHQIYSSARLEFVAVLVKEGRFLIRHYQTQFFL